MLEVQDESSCQHNTEVFTSFPRDYPDQIQGVSPQAFLSLVAYLVIIDTQW